MFQNTGELVEYLGIALVVIVLLIILVDKVRRIARSNNPPPSMAKSSYIVLGILFALGIVLAVATGASGVEATDAFSGVPSWEVVQERLAAGWPELPSRTVPDRWIATPCGNRCRR